MRLFDGIFNGLRGSVGQNLKNDPNDIKKIERVLNRMGYFKGDYSEGFITAELDKGIRKFQRDNNLKTDGVMHPNGETEQALLKKVKEADSINSPIQKNNPPTQKVRDAFEQAQENLQDFKEDGYELSEKFLKHYLGKSGEPMEISAEDIDKASLYRDAMKTNQKRFEDSIVKGVVDRTYEWHGNAASGKEGTPSPFKDQILSLKDGETITLNNPKVKDGSDAWDRDIGRLHSMLKDPDHGRSLGAVKLRSVGHLNATRRGNIITINGTVNHNINDTYDFNNDTVLDKMLLGKHRTLAEEGYAAPFPVRGTNPQKVTGTLEIKNGRITNPQFRWDDIEQ